MEKKYEKDDVFKNLFGETAEEMYRKSNDRLDKMIEAGAAAGCQPLFALGATGRDDYCTQNGGDCSTCSLVNYGRDCRNNPIPDED